MVVPEIPSGITISIMHNRATAPRCRASQVPYQKSTDRTVSAPTPYILQTHTRTHALAHSPRQPAIVRVPVQKPTSWVWYELKRHRTLSCTAARDSVACARHCCCCCCRRCCREWRDVRPHKKGVYNVQAYQCVSEFMFSSLGTKKNARNQFIRNTHTHIRVRRPAPQKIRTYAFEENQIQGNFKLDKIQID